MPHRFVTDTHIRPPEVEFVQMRCKECRMIFSLPRKKDPYFDITMLLGKKQRSICPECGSARLELWKPERSFFASLMRQNRVHLRNGAIVACDHNLLFVRTGICVRHLGIVHILNGRPVCSSVRLFLRNGNSLLPGVNLYVACTGTDPLSFAEAAQRARAALEDSTTFPNGHAFLAWCLTGEMLADQAYPFPHLEYLMGRMSPFDSWVAYGK